MNRKLNLLLAAGLLATALPATADDLDPARPSRESTSTEQMRERPDDVRSRYPSTEIEKSPAAQGNIEPPHEGSAMEMNDATDDVNDSTLEMPRR